MVVRRVCLVLAGLALLSSFGLAQAATVTVLKEGADLTAGGALNSAFSGAGPANVASQTVNDTGFSSNTAAAYERNGNLASYTGMVIVKFDLSAIGPGSKIYKAQLRFKCPNGNNTVTCARIVTHNWIESSCCFAGPDGPTSPRKTWGPNSDSYFSAADYTTPVNFESAPAGAAYLVKDVTADVQDFIDNKQPNYGWYVSSGNHPLQLSENGTDGDRPALFISFDPNQAPQSVADLAVTGNDWNRVDLRWTAPSDLPPGPIHHYDLRMSTSLIDDSNFDVATPVPPPAAGAPGTVQTLSVNGLSAETTYWFAIKCYDATDLVSTLSNVVSSLTIPMDVIAPAPINTLAATVVKPNYATLTWTAVGDDGSVGVASRYDIHYSTNPIVDDVSFAAATVATGLPVPQPAGQTETFTLHGLLPSTTYYFVIKAGDEVPNWSSLSIPAIFTTLPADCCEPNPISDLRVSAAQIHEAFLTWTAPADVGTAGLAGYDVRYSTSPIDESNWDAALQVTDEPMPATPGTRELVSVKGLQPDTTYYFAVKSFDYAEPVHVSAISNTASGKTMPPIVPVTVHNPWLVNDRVADMHNINTMAATYVNAYTPDGMIAPANNEQKAINIYNNQKRRLYHWTDEPPALGGNSISDPTYNQNVFGWALCGRHGAMGMTLSNAAGFTGSRNVGIPGHNIYEAYYDGAYHLLDTMTTMYVYTRDNPPHVASCAEIAADATLQTAAVAEKRACPGFLLCGDDPVWYSGGLGHWGAGSNTPIAAKWTGAMDIRFGQSFQRTCQSWFNQHPPIGTGSPAGTTPPYHHESNKDWKDTVNFPYWEPYALTSAQSTAINITYNPTYRRWANGTDTLVPDFRSAGYQAMLEPTSHDIKTFNDDGLTPDLHTKTVGTVGEAIFKINFPYYITDASFSGDFVKTNTGDTCKVFTSKDGTTWTQVYDAPAGATHVANQPLRSNVFAAWTTWYIKIQLKGTTATTGVGISNFTVVTTFEHNKGAMPYLDKGVNNITLTFDNASELLASRNLLHVVYQWKEYDGTGWNINRSFSAYTTTSPTTFTINVGGNKVPRTESVLLEVVAPIVDPYMPDPIQDLRASSVQARKVQMDWTATGDDGQMGTATSYELRYSTSPITDEASFAAATLVDGVPAPRAFGSPESFTVTGLQPLTTYWLAIKAHDKGSNSSDLSNVVMITTTDEDHVVPRWVGNLRAAPSKTSSSVDLTWTAPADYGQNNAGPYTCTSYDLRYSTSPITEANFASATAVTTITLPQTYGTAEAFTVGGLVGGTRYYFAIKAADDTGNVSEISNCATANASVIGERTIQTSGVRDSYLYAGGATNNYGVQERMTVCGYADTAATNVMRGIIRFDTASIPTTATLTKATLWLYSYDATQTKGSSGFYGAYPLTKDWTEAGVTWSTTNGSAGWTTPGGDFDATPDGTSRKQGTASTWYNFDVSNRVQTWITAPAGNFGWVIKCTDENLHNQDRFYQTDTVNGTYRPKLVITDLPTPVACDVNGDSHVDMLDLLALANSWAGRCGIERAYDPMCDFNDDGNVDVVDLLILAESWGQ